MDSLLTNVMVAQQSGGGGGAALVIGCVFNLIMLAVAIVMIAGAWKMFAKAGQPGWGCIVPIYNGYLLCKIAGRPGWWLILLILFPISIIFGIIVSIDIAKSFGKDVGFGIGIAFLGFIFIPILGFGDAQYQGPAAA